MELPEYDVRIEIEESPHINGSKLALQGDSSFLFGFLFLLLFGQNDNIYKDSLCFLEGGF